MDLGLSSDPYESFKLFQGRILEEYDRIVPEYGLSAIDATQSLVRQQDQMRALVKPYLDGALKTSPRGWRDVLAEESLLGRYLEEIGAHHAGENGDNTK